jgi:hypothetical protein
MIFCCPKVCNLLESLPRLFRGNDYSQTTFSTLDDQPEADNPVRLMDAFVDKLNLVEPGFGKLVHKSEGRPPYEGGTLLKLCLYGYPNKMPAAASRKGSAGGIFNCIGFKILLHIFATLKAACIVTVGSGKGFLPDEYQLLRRGLMPAHLSTLLRPRRDGKGKDSGHTPAT